MSGTPVYINVQQLMIDRGRQGHVSDRPTPISTSESAATLNEAIHAIQELLAELNAPEALITLTDAVHVRIRLSHTSIQWLEKTENQINKYDLKLTDGRLWFNGNATDPSFKQSFSEKLDRLMGAITTRSFQLYAKEDSNGN